MGTPVGTLEAYLKLNIDDFEQNLEAARRQVASVSAGFDVLSAVGGNIAKVGTALTLGLTTPLMGVGTACTKITADFDAAMSKVSAISGATGEDLLALRAKAKEMGETTKFSATESAEAFTYMAMAGWDTQQMLAGISGIMNLAAADGLDLATTSDIVTDALTAFGLQASDAAHFADVLAKASSSANTNVSMLGESFKYVAPVAGALGYSVEDTAVALGIMANAGIKGSQAGTALRAALSRMVKPTGDAATVMDTYGISLTNADGSMKSLGDVMGTLRQQLGSLSEAQQAQVATTLFGQEAMSGMLAIINASDEDFAKLTEQINNADGAAQSMADTMNDNLSGQLVLLKSQLEGVAIQIGEILVPHIRTFLTHVSDWVARFSELMKSHGDLVLKIAAVAIAIGPVLTVVGKSIQAYSKLRLAISNISAIITAMNTSLAAAGTSLLAMAGPVLAVVAVIAVLVAAFHELWTTNEGFRDAMTSIWNGIVQSFNGFCQGMVDRLNTLGFDFKNIVEVLQAAWSGFCSLLAPIFEGAFATIAAILDGAFAVLTGLFDVFSGIFTGNWSMVWTGIQGIFQGVWDSVVSILTAASSALIGIIDTMLGWCGSSWEQVWTNVSTFFSNIVQGIVTTATNFANGFNSVWTAVAAFFVNVWNQITTTVTGIVQGIVSFIQANFGQLSTSISTILTGIQTVFTNIWTIIKNVVGGIILAFIDLITMDFQQLQSDMSSIMSNISTALSQIWNGICAIVTGVVDTIVGFISGAWSSIQQISSTVWSAIKNVVSTAINGAKTALQNGVNSAKSAVVTGFNAMKTGVSTAINGVKTAIVNGFNNAVSFIKNLASEAPTWGSHMVQGFAQGVKNAMSSLLATVKSMASQVRSFLHFTRPDKGPLRDYETWMPDMVEGLAKTLQAAAPGLIQRVKDMSDSMAGALTGGTYQVAFAGIGADIRAGGERVDRKDYSILQPRKPEEDKNPTSIYIEKIEVRDDHDLDMVTQGLYNKQDQNLRALGRRNI